MPISNLDGLIAAPKQRVVIRKTGTVTSVALMNTQLLAAAGEPGAGVLDGTSTTAGVVPTSATQGFPPINTFGGGAVGYLAGVEFGASVTSRLKLYDCLWKGGAYAFNAAVSLSVQPSFSSRVPGGTDFNGLEIWMEATTAFTGNQSIAVTYQNQAGTAGRTTGTIATGVAPIASRMLQLPLQGGDAGVQRIDSVTSTVSTVGTFNILVLRPLWSGRVAVNNGGDVHDFARVGMPIVFQNSALMLLSQPDGTSTGVIDVVATIANG